MRIALFVTCLADTLFPDVGKATVRLLERLGHQVEFPQAQTCCGQMHVNTGYQREALPLIRRYVETFERYDVIVAPSGSCVGSIRHQHAMVARRLRRRRPRPPRGGGGQPDVRAVAVARRRARGGGRRAPTTRTGSPTTRPATRCGCCGSATGRSGCCARSRGLELVELPDAEVCCGFGGTFAVKNADTSTAMLADKMRNVLGTRAEVCTAGDSSCLMHIGGGLSRLQRGREDRAPGRDPRLDPGRQMRHLLSTSAVTPQAAGRTPRKRCPGAGDPPPTEAA